MFTLSNIKLTRKLAAMAWSPLAVAVLFAVIYVDLQLEIKDSADRSGDIVPVFLALDSVVNSLSEERTLSAAYMGTSGQGFSAQLRRQRLHTEEMVADLSSTISAARYMDPDKMRTLTATAYNSLAQKPDIQRRIDRLDQSLLSTVNAYYGELIAQFLLASQQLAIEMNQADYVASLTAVGGLQWLKERESQARALLTGVYAKKQSTEWEHRKISSFIQRLQGDQARFNFAALSNEKQQLQAVLNSSDANRVKDLQQSFLRQSESLESIAGPDVRQWYDLSGAYAGELENLVQTIAGDLKQRTERAISKALWLITLALASLAFLGLLSLLGSVVVMRDLSQRVGRVKDTIRHILDDSDLRTRISMDCTDEIGILAKSVNELLGKVDGVFGAVKSAVIELEHQAETLKATTENSLQRAQAQMQETMQAASATTQMASTSQQVASSTTSATAATDKARQHSESSKQIVAQAVSAMDNLTDQVSEAQDMVNTVAEDSDKIGSITETISTIAGQTNLLALNAAIESARAGEQGRGFAVVADEVRSLASRTQEATKEIQEMIERLQSKSAHAQSLMDKSRDILVHCSELSNDTGAHINDMGQMIEQINELNIHISAAIEQQSITAGEVSGNVERISLMALKSKEASEVSNCGGERLATMSDHLGALVNDYQVSVEHSH